MDAGQPNSMLRRSTAPEWAGLIDLKIARCAEYVFSAVEFNAFNNSQDGGGPEACDA